MLRPLLTVLALLAAICRIEPAAAQSITEVKTKSGIRAWLVQSAASEVVSFRFAFTGGSTQEPPSKAGVTTLLAETLREGAGDLDAAALKRQLDLNGVKLSFAAGRDALAGNADMLARNLERSIELVRLIVQSPRFDDMATGRARARLLERIGEEARDSRAVAEQAWYRAAFGDHPYAASALATRETVAPLGRGDLVAHHRNLFARSNIAIVAVGSIGPDAFAGYVDRMFADLPLRASLPPVAAVPSAAPGTTEVALPEASGATIVFGGPALPRRHADFPAMLVANRILGGGQLDSRLSRAIRFDTGLAYSAATSLVSDGFASVLLGEVETDMAKAAQARDVLRAELGRLASDGADAAEVEAAKSFLIGSYAIALESNAALADALLSARLDGFTRGDVAARGSRLSAVTAADVRRVAAQMLRPDRLRFVIVSK